MERLRVAHLITRLEMGGAQLATLYTTGRLRRDEFEPFLLYGEPGLLEARAIASAPSERVASLVHPIRPHRDLQATLALARRLRRLAPHIVHTHSSKAGILGRVAARLARVPIVVHTVHGFGFTPAQAPWVRASFIAVERYCASLTDHLLFVSEDNLRRAIELDLLRGASASVIRSGIVTRPATVTRVRSELGIADRAWVVAWVGNFKPQKNPLELARVAAALVERDADVHVLLVGDGELRAEVERVLARSLPATRRVHVLGWRRDVPEVLAAANAFLLTSLWEGLPRALVEAFAAGLPAVAHPVDGIRDLLVDGHNGFAPAVGDVAQMVERLLWLKHHPDQAARMSEHARAAVRSEFDVDEMVRAQERLYHALWSERLRNGRRRSI